MLKSKKKKVLVLQERNYDIRNRLSKKKKSKLFKSTFIN